jgi:hypothetical protein
MAAAGGDMLKINTDGGLSMDARRGVAGGVVRSHSAYLGAWSKPYEGITDPLIIEAWITDPLIIEALTLRDGVIFAKFRGFPKVVMETDSLELINP